MLQQDVQGAVQEQASWPVGALQQTQESIAEALQSQLSNMDGHMHTVQVKQPFSCIIFCIVLALEGDSKAEAAECAGPGS